MDNLYFSDYLKDFINRHGYTLASLISKFEKENGKIQGMSYNNIREKLDNNTISFIQVDNLLMTMGYKIVFKPINEEIKGNWFNL